MRILFICHRFPFPPQRGGKIRPFNMIRHLATQHEVVVASLAHTAEEMQAGAGLKDHCSGIIAEVLPNRMRWSQAIAALPSGTPSSVAYFWSGRLAQRIREAWQGGGFDGVIVHCAFVAGYAAGLREGFRLLDFGDLDSGKWFDYSRFRGFPLSLGYGLEARKLRRYEQRMASEFGRCTVTTEGEREEFQRLNVSVPCTVIPNGVDAMYFQSRVKQPGGPPAIVFLGRMDYFPNIDAISSFATLAFPLIRKILPQAELRIIGSDPVASIRRLARIPGITVTGFVPDVRPYLADATVAVAPLRIARGTQNKILECMAAGIPVVATPEAAKGIQASPGRHLLVAGNAQGFADLVTKVMQDQGLRKRLSEEGRRQVETAHSWPNSMRLLDGVLAEWKE
jgi:sugar transferase (PEP-CTERM/EpsH1 system associated)